MKIHKILLVVAVVLLPSLAMGQAPCPCSPRSKTVVRSYYPVEYPVYEMDGCRGGGRQHQLGAYAQNSTAGGVPLTVRNMLRTLDCLIPCGPRSGHGCGITCVGAGSGCLRGYCRRDITYCPNCGAKPFACDCCAGSLGYASPGPVYHACQFEPTAASPVEAYQHQHNVAPQKSNP